MYYTITVDDKTKELVIYTVNEAGLFTTKRLPFNIPSTAGKWRNELSEYFSNLQVIKSGEEPDLSTVVSSAKIFSYPGKLEFVINDEGNPTHIFTIQVPSFAVQEKFIDFSAFQSSGNDKIMLNSFSRKDRLFSLILDKKTIRVAVHNISTGKLQSKYEINEEFSMFAKNPVNEYRMGKRSKEGDIDNTKKVIKTIGRGTEGIMVSENDKGQFIVTIGSYNLIRTSTGGSDGEWVGGFQQSTKPGTPDNHGQLPAIAMVHNSHMYYRPGRPSYTTESARYYTSIYFKVLLDPAASKIEKGSAGTSVAGQIKDYLELADPKAKATNQFSIGERQFYGYYDKEIKAYVVEEIKIRK
jgi:hypothetical protein